MLRLRLAAALRRCRRRRGRSVPHAAGPPATRRKIGCHSAVDGLVPGAASTPQLLLLLDDDSVYDGQNASAGDAAPSVASDDDERAHHRVSSRVRAAARRDRCARPSRARGAASSRLRTHERAAVDGEVVRVRRQRRQDHALAPRAPVDRAQRRDARLHEVHDDLVAGERRQVRLEPRRRRRACARVRARIDGVDGQLVDAHAPGDRRHRRRRARRRPRPTAAAADATRRRRDRTARPARAPPRRRAATSPTIDRTPPRDRRRRRAPPTASRAVFERAARHVGAGEARGASARRRRAATTATATAIATLQHRRSILQ